MLNESPEGATLAFTSYIAPQTENKESAGRHPLARRRAAEAIVMGLLQGDQFSSEGQPLNPFLTFPIYEHELEAQALDQGIPVESPLIPPEYRNDDEFKQKVLRSMQNCKLRVCCEQEPRTVLLKVEPDDGGGNKGMGVFGKGEFLAGEFFTWYVGPKVDGDGFGWFMKVDVRNRSGSRCNGEPCPTFPLKRVLALGGMGAHVNADQANPNLKMEEDGRFEHDGLLWTPMSVLRRFKDAFTGWKYDPKSRLLGTTAAASKAADAAAAPDRDAAEDGRGKRQRRPTS
jgi:hypothetical protein